MEFPPKSPLNPCFSQDEAEAVAGSADPAPAEGEAAEAPNGAAEAQQMAGMPLDATGCPWVTS